MWGHRGEWGGRGAARARTLAFCLLALGAVAGLPSTASAGVAQANLDIDKEVDLDQAFAGEDLTYTITVTNLGPAAAAGVEVTDDLPNSLEFVSATPDQGTCTQADPVVCQLGSIANGADAEIVIVANVRNDQGGTTIVNTATVDSTSNDPDLSNNSASDGTDIFDTDGFYILKEASPDPVAAGGQLTYTLTVGNESQFFDSPDVFDDLPASVTLVSATPSQGTCTQVDPVECDLGAMPGGAQATVTIVVTVNADQAGNQITNEATVISNCFGKCFENDENDTDSATVGVLPVADLAITKTAAPDPVEAGANLTYTLTVTNNGPNTATDVEVIDDFPASLTLVSATPDQGSCTQTDPIDCDLGTMPLNDTAQITIVATVGANQHGNQISNTADVSSPVFDPDLSNNSDSVTVGVPPEADLAITKTAAPDPVEAGADLTYTLTVTNNGPNTATSVEVIDDLPASLTLVSATPDQGSCTQTDPIDCDLGTILSGGDAEIVIVATVGANQHGNQISNTADVSSPVFDPDLSNNQDSATVGVPPEADLAITKTAVPDPVQAGADLTYTLTVTNNGPSPATNTEVNDDLPSSLTLVSATPDQGTCNQTDPVVCDLGTVPVGGTVEITIVATVGGNQQGNSISNTATVESPVFDPDLSNNTDTVRVNVPPEADLAITKTATPDPVSAGAELTYTLTVTNNGPNAAQNAQVQDDLPASLTLVSATPDQGTCTQTDPVTCDLGNIPVSGTVEITIVTTVGGDQQGNTISNTATVNSETPDPNLENNQDGVDVSVPEEVPEADLRVTKGASPKNGLKVGDLVTYTITVDNLGPDDAVDVTLTDEFDFKVKLLSATPSQGTCTVAKPIECDLGTIPNGGSVTIEVEARPKEHGKGLLNTAAAETTTDESNLENNQDTAAINVERVDIGLAKKVDQKVAHSGDVVTFTITLRSLAKVSIDKVKVCDRLPNRLTLVNAPGATVNGGKPCWTVGLAPQEKREFELKARVKRTDVERHVINLATAVSPETERKRATAPLKIIADESDVDPGGCPGSVPFDRAASRC